MKNEDKRPLKSIEISIEGKPSLDNLLCRIAEINASWYTEFVGYRSRLRYWIDASTMPDPSNRMVWDLGCGWGGFSLAFLAEGANKVVGTDTFLDRQRIPAALWESGLLELRQGDTVALAADILTASDAAEPLIFMHLMTEHVANLQDLLHSIRKHCPPGTQLFIHHDNYYQPVGHHDHGFLMLNPERHAIESLAVPCWADPRRCESSEAYRARLRKERSWQWSPASEDTRDPPVCENCNYRARARPWAHLIFADRFSTVWPEKWFSSALNKITHFQLRQYLIEAGFEITRDVQDLLNNEVPSDLQGRFTETDLRSFTFTLVAVPK